jgi:hypothetical protein
MLEHPALSARLLINTPKRRLGINNLACGRRRNAAGDKGHVRWHGKGLRAALDKTASTKS